MLATETMTPHGQSGHGVVPRVSPVMSRPAAKKCYVKSDVDHPSPSPSGSYSTARYMTHTPRCLAAAAPCVSLPHPRRGQSCPWSWPRSHRPLPLGYRSPWSSITRLVLSPSISISTPAFPLLLAQLATVTASIRSSLVPETQRSRDWH